MLFIVTNAGQGFLMMLLPSYSLCAWFVRASPKSAEGLRVEVICVDAIGSYVTCLFCGQADPANTSEVAGGAPTQMRSSESSGAPDLSGAPDHREYRYSMLQARCAWLEQDLRATQGVLAILRSKQPRPVE